MADFILDILSAVGYLDDCRFEGRGLLANIDELTPHEVALGFVLFHQIFKILPYVHNLVEYKRLGHFVLLTHFKVHLLQVTLELIHVSPHFPQIFGAIVEAVFNPTDPILHHGNGFLG